MTLATRCPACGTVFRVVQDQLRVSQGWVRCGRCAEAFNALESMVDPPLARVPMPSPAVPSNPVATDTQVLPEPAPVPAWSSMQAPASADGSMAPPGELALSPQPLPDTAPGATVSVAESSPSLIELPPGISFIASDGAVSLPASAAAEEPDGAAMDVDIGLDASVAAESSTTDAVAAAVAGDPTAATAAADAAAALPQPTLGGNVPVDAAMQARPGDTEQAPSFIVQADRAERWRRPAVRRTMRVLSALSVLGLAVQVTLVFRDRLAVSAPWMRPALQQACATLGCRVGDYRQIESLSVESSGLQRVEGAPVYRLAVTLRNRAAVDVAAPALDLALTDAQGRQIARRVLQMSDLNLPLRNLKAGSELPIQVPLGINERQVSGYTVEIFYP